MTLDGEVVWSTPTSQSVYSVAVDTDGSVFGIGTVQGTADLDTSTVWPDGRDLVTSSEGQGTFVALELHRRYALRRASREQTRTPVADTLMCDDCDDVHHDCQGRHGEAIGPHRCCDRYGCASVRCEPRSRWRQLGSLHATEWLRRAPDVKAIVFLSATIASTRANSRKSERYRT
jgi:hypothetical protein